MIQIWSSSLSLLPSHSLSWDQRFQISDHPRPQTSPHRYSQTRLNPIPRTKTSSASENQLSVLPRNRPPSAEVNQHSSRTQLNSRGNPHPGLVVSYNIRPGNGLGLFYSQHPEPAQGKMLHMREENFLRHKLTNG